MIQHALAASLLEQEKGGSLQSSLPTAEGKIASEAKIRSSSSSSLILTIRLHQT